MNFAFKSDENGKRYLKVTTTGYELINNPILNKGMAFTEAERAEFGLFGLLPPSIINMNIQLVRTMKAFNNKPSDIEKFIYLRDLQDSNETLFFRFLLDNLDKTIPIVYTPTVGLGCERYSQIYRRARGLFISYPDKHRISDILNHPRFNKVAVIVVSDGERILGLGDQGAGGMGIPIGKLALYTACAGFHPITTLPILLDTGTNNPELKNDPLYIGWHHERLRGKEYDDFIDAFVVAVKKRFPHVLLQWEDFALQNANKILDKYRDQLCTFNDDIQGTAAVLLGAMFSAIRLTGTNLTDQRIVVVGAGSAGCGLSKLILEALLEEGLTKTDAYNHLFLVDRQGLLTEDAPDLLPFQKPFIHPKSEVAHWKLENPNEITLEDVIKNVRPTILIGTSGQPGIFSEKIIREMAKHITHPIIFPLSNPTTRCEAAPADLLKWTDEKAIIGTGTPFEAILKKGKLFQVDQINNSYIFPGLGLGITSVKAKQVTDSMFMVAARALANCSPPLGDPEKHIFLPLTEIRSISFQIALAVANEAIQLGLATYQPNDLGGYIKELMWVPDYLPYRK